MNNEKQKPETLPEAIDLRPLDLPPGRKLLAFRSVQVMFHHAVKAGLAQKDGAEMLRPDAFDVTDTDGRKLSMTVARSVDTATDEDGSGTYSIECRTEDEESGVIRSLKVERDDATNSYDVSFGSTDELAETANVRATEKVAMHLTKAESILLSVLGEEEDDVGDDDRHLAAAHAILGAAMYGGGPREVTAEKTQTIDAPVIDLAAERRHRRL